MAERLPKPHLQILGGSSKIVADTFL